MLWNGALCDQTKLLKNRLRSEYKVDSITRDADDCALDGGAREDRTPDLLRARQALSQLSYGPLSTRWGLGTRDQGFSRP